MNNASDLYAATLSGSERDILTDLKAQFWADLYALPTYYDKNDVQNQAEFKAFTNVYGTHLITNVTYGTRLELIISCSAGNSEINANFKANIEAEYKGVIGSGSGSADIKGSGEYKQYEKDRNTSIVVRGGDPSKRAVLQQSLQQNKVDEKAAIDWASSGRGIGNEALVHMDTVSLGELVANSDNEFERQVGQALNDYTMHVMYANEIQSVPTTLNSKYGPCFVAWSPLGGGGTITITLKGDPLAQFTDFYPSKGEPILSEDRRTIQCTFTSGIQGRLVAIALFGVECGSHGTDVEITSSSSDTWATLQMNLSPSGDKNGASPYNYSLIYHYFQSGSKLFVPRAQLASRGQSESVIGDIFRVGDYGF